MPKFSWVKFRSHHGVKYMGNQKFMPAEPWSVWDTILGVVARCEGNYDTVISYDGTGVTFGFQQWTFTSGRLQKLLQSFKAIPVYDYDLGEDPEETTLFDVVCCDPAGTQYFEEFGFRIQEGCFVESATGKVLKPRKKAHKKRINDICMGRTMATTAKGQKAHAMGLARVFARIGADFAVAEAQTAFAKAEFKRQIKFKRPPLGGKSIEDVLGPNCWTTPLPALFLNLWQNHPAQAYKMLLRARKSAGTGDPQRYFETMWKMANVTKFANWGWGSGKNKSPRVIRIKKAIREFYGVNLPYYKG